MAEIQQPSIRAALVVARAQMPAWLVSAALLAVLALILVVQRCWVGAHMDFETDEAYYWMWSRWLAPSYYDHPPMVAYLIRLGTLLFGDSLLGIRSMAILALIAAYVLLYVFAVVLFPDTPAILFWVATCVAAALIWRTGRGEWWYLLGLSAGLLLLSKYTALFLLFSIAAWLVVAKDMRFWLSRREPFLAALIALILFSPVLWWNADHGWVSFIKQFGRAFETSADAGIGN